MKNKMLGKSFVFGIIVLFIGMNVTLSTGNGLKENQELPDNKPIGIYGSNLDYWALIVGVGVYAKHPEQNISSHLDAEAMYNSLISSEHWQEDHIRLITCENATKTNITKGFRWLDEMEDKDDVSVIYISTHGGQLSLFGMPLDLPPFDETDHCDEVLATYNSFANPLTYLRDDELKFLVDKLESQGICIIIDSCYSGGFNDTSRRISLSNNPLVYDEQTLTIAEGSLQVDIEIKPGSYPNCFNQNEHGVIPVAVLGSAYLDVTEIIPESLSLQGLAVKVSGKSDKNMVHTALVDDDPYPDLVVQFEDSDDWTASGEDTARLSGQLADGTPIEGTDTICIVP